MKCSISGNAVFHFVMLLPIVTVQTNKLNALEGWGSSNACQMLASTENQLRFNGFSLRERKHQPGKTRMPYTTITTRKALVCQAKPQQPRLHWGHCSIRATGTRPHPPTSSITYASPTQLYFLRTMTNSERKQLNV